MHICTHLAQATSSPHYLWSLLTQPQVWPLWDPGILQVEAEGALQKGSTVQVTQAGGGQSTWTVVELLKPERLVVQRPHTRGTEVQIQWEIGQEGDQVNIQQVTTLTGPLLQVLARSRDKGGLQQASARQLQGLVDALNGKHRSGTQGKGTVDTPAVP